MPEQECGLFEFSCKTGKFVARVATDGIEGLAAAIMDGLSEMVSALSVFWVAMPSINLTTVDGQSPSPTVDFLQDGLWYFTASLAVLAVIIGGMRLAWEQRGEPVRSLLRAMLTLTLVSGMGLAVVALLVVALDKFSIWIIEDSTDGLGFANALRILVLLDQQHVGTFLLIVLGLIGILTTLVQVALMIVRGGILVILAGILPTTASFTNTEMGRQWFQKAVGWTIAFILYKPTAAVVYAAAFKLMGTDMGTSANVLVNSITGLALMIVALLALPALMRLVAPMVSAVAAGTGGGAFAAAALGAAATGAVSLGRSGSGRGNSSPIPGSASKTGGDKENSSAATRSATGSVGKGSTAAGKSSGSSAAAGAGGKTPAFSGASSAGSSAAGASTGAKAGAAAGPAGVAAGAAASAATQAAKAAQQVSEEAAGEGPSGSNR
ncbi:hypothetical protein [Crystallibacter degradans]|uniref:hypothetical protein n=1 Tax=Crystallibacter degradans TaxID=2726743 RepID=UPI0014766859|nr:hypothetical protein [Arthrobacter sp. SF27]NMR32325.1 hypothetical protein [Arthrobacter sp. SF27]